MLLMAGDIEEAIDVLEEVATFNNAQELLGKIRDRIQHELTDQLVEVAQQAIDQGQSERADRVLNRILEIRPDHQQALGLLHEISELQPAEVMWGEAIDEAASPAEVDAGADQALLDRVETLLAKVPEHASETDGDRLQESPSQVELETASLSVGALEKKPVPARVTALEPPGLGPPRLMPIQSREHPSPAKARPPSAVPDRPVVSDRPAVRDRTQTVDPLTEVPKPDDHDRQATSPNPHNVAWHELGIDDVQIRSDPDPLGSSVAAQAQPAYKTWIPRAAIVLIALGLILVAFQQFQRPAVAPSIPVEQPPPLPEPQVARVLVAATESGLVIWKDGEETGQQTPADFKLEGVPGEQVLIELKRNDGDVVARARWTIGLDVPASWQPEIVPAPPEPEPLIVQSEPPGARLVFDGRDVGVTPATLSIETEQSHTLELSLDGYEPENRKLSWETLTTEQRNAGEMTIHLQPTTGRLVVSAPYSVRLYVDGVDRGILSSLELEPGSYSVRATAPDVFYFGKPRSVTIEAGKNSQWNLPPTVHVQLIPDPSNCVVWINQQRISQVQLVNLLPITVGRHTFKFYWPAFDRDLELLIDVTPSTRVIRRLMPAQ